MTRLIHRYKRLSAGGFFSSFYYAGKYFLLKGMGQKQLQRPIHGYDMVLNIDDQGLSRQLAITGTREPQLAYILKRIVKKGGVILDLGANIGYYCMMLCNLCGPEGFVYAVEPFPGNFDLLKKNIDLNGMGSRVEALPIAVGSEIGTSTFHLSVYNNMHTCVPQNSDGLANTKGLTGETLEVPTVDLSSFLIEKRSIELIRMDIEGFEVDVLKGLREAVSKELFTGDIVFEIHRPKYSKERSLVKELEYYFESGYRPGYMTTNDDVKAALKDHYEAEKLFRTNDMPRFCGVYANVSQDDCIKFIDKLGGIRDLHLTKRKNFQNLQ
jgi:FkbM family methyltransferase